MKRNTNRISYVGFTRASFEMQCAHDVAIASAMDRARVSRLFLSRRNRKRVKEKLYYRACSMNLIELMKQLNNRQLKIHTAAPFGSPFLSIFVTNNTRKIKKRKLVGRHSRACAYLCERYYKMRTAFRFHLL